MILTHCDHVDETIEYWYITACVGKKQSKLRMIPKEQKRGKNDDQVFEVELLLSMREMGNVRQYLVKWKDYDVIHNSWEPEN